MEEGNMINVKYNCCGIGTHGEAHQLRIVGKFSDGRLFVAVGDDIHVCTHQDSWELIDNKIQYVKVMRELAKKLEPFNPPA